MDVHHPAAGTVTADAGAGIGEGDVRAAVARLPGAEERAHHGHPDFRVQGRIFATLWPTQHRSVLRLTQEDAEGIARLEPETYRLVSNRGPYAWLSVDLRRVAGEQFGRLLEQAWRLRAEEEPGRQGGLPRQRGRQRRGHAGGGQDRA